MEGESTNLTELTGFVNKIIFSNEENGYTVCELESESDITTVTGVMPFLSEREHIRVTGSYFQHKTFGMQFKAEYFEKIMPADETGIIDYLSSGIITGIGKTTAKRLFDRFGNDVFDVMENHPDLLCDIRGINPKRAKSISEAFKAKSGIKNIVEFFADAVEASTALKIYKELGSNTIDIVKNNPYILCENIEGITFGTADRIAASYGYVQNSPNRIAAGIRYVLDYNMNSNGHMFIPYTKLIPMVSELLHVDVQEVASRYEELTNDGSLIEVMIKKIRAVYIPQNFETEVYAVRKLRLLNNESAVIADKDFSIYEEIENIELDFGIEYSERQVEAIVTAVSHGVFILTGGPGTGKTTVIKAIIRILMTCGKKVHLAAPTGRAAQRITQATGMEAKTIHRLLEITYENNRREPVFNRCEENPLDADVVIIDEASMIDAYIFDYLLRACTGGMNLILIGDTDQLPPVGPGNIFRDIIRSDAFGTVKLDRIFRQSEESYIISNAHRINKGEYIEYGKSKASDFFFMERGNSREIAETIAGLCTTRLPKAYGSGVLEGIQVITPTKKGITGTHNLNARLQECLNPNDGRKREIKRFGYIFRENDKVMQIKNNYTIEWETDGGEKGIGIFNGDIGTILKIDHIDQALTIDFDGRIVIYSFMMLEELIHGYAVTVHKSQGSEYPIVILAISNEVSRTHTRNLLYTAVTRAQKMLIIVSDKKILNRMVDNNVRTNRYTGLCEQLML